MDACLPIRTHFNSKHTLIDNSTNEWKFISASTETNQD